MSDVDIIAAEHIIVSAQYKSKDWTDKYLVPVEQYRASEQRLTEKEKIIKDLISDQCELEEQFIGAGFSDYDTHGDYKGLAVQVEECLIVLAKQKDSITQLRECVKTLINYIDVDNLTTQTVVRQAEQVLQGTKSTDFS